MQATQRICSELSELWVLVFLWLEVTQGYPSCLPVLVYFSCDLEGRGLSQSIYLVSWPWLVFHVGVSWLDQGEIPEQQEEG